MSRRTKIVCTLGPSSGSPESIRALIEAGMDVARLNFSHGSHDDHGALYGRGACTHPTRRDGRSPSWPTSRAPRSASAPSSAAPRYSNRARRSLICGEPTEGTCERASITYAAVAQDVRPGDTLLLDDGLVSCGPFRQTGSHVSLPGDRGRTALGRQGSQPARAPGSASAPSPRRTWTTCASPCDLGVDLVALSFVRRRRGRRPVRRVMDAAGRRVPVSPRSRSPRRSTTSTRSSTRSTA